MIFIHVLFDLAGAHWLSMAANDDIRSQKYDKLSFEVFETLVDKNPTIAREMGLFKVKGYEAWETKPVGFEFPWFKDIVPDFHVLSIAELPPGLEFGFGYETVCIDVPVYILWLLDQFKASNGELVYKTINHIDQMLDGADIIINCSGLQSRTLQGVEDLLVSFFLFFYSLLLRNR